MASEVIASIIAAATALVAVIVGPFVTIRAAKKHMLGPMRQAWINSLRDTVSEYIAHLSVARMQMSTSLSDSDEIRSRHQLDERARLQTAYQLKEKVCLLINPRETDPSGTSALGRKCLQRLR